MYESKPTYGRNFKLFWKEIPPPSQNGIIIGYSILYQETSVVANSSDGGVYFYNISTNLKLVPPPESLEITNLELKTNYTVKIAGITSKGIGVYSGPFDAETGDYSEFFSVRFSE